MCRNTRRNDLLTPYGLSKPRIRLRIRTHTHTSASDEFTASLILVEINYYFRIGFTIRMTHLSRIRVRFVFCTKRKSRKRLNSTPALPFLASKNKHFVFLLCFVRSKNSCTLVLNTFSVRSLPFLYLMLLLLMHPYMARCSCYIHIKSNCKLRQEQKRNSENKYMAET